MAIATGQFTLLDINDVSASIPTVQPTNPALDALWLDTSVTPNLLKRWNGSTWVVVNDIISARNLIRNSTFAMSTSFDKWTNQGSFTLLTPESDKPYSNIAKKTNSGSQSNVYLSLYSNRFMAKKDDILTFSTDFKIEDDALYDAKYPFIIEFYNSTGTRVQYKDVTVSDVGLQTIVNNKWYRISYTITVTATDVVEGSIRLCLFKNGTAYYREVKVEVGGRPSEWSQAPEDIQEQIDGINNEIYTPTTGIKDKLTTTVSDLNIAKDDITAKVGKAEVETYRNKTLKFRYVRDYLHGSTYNLDNHWIELKVMKGTTNLASGKTPTSDQTLTNGSKITDGVITSGSSDYAQGTNNTLQYVQIDLGSVYEGVDYIQTWHYWADNRKYHNTKVQVSEDGATWVTLFDSSVAGEYTETSSGLVVPVNIGWAFNTVNTRLADAEVKITNDAITATVRNHSSYKGDLDNISGKNKWLVKRYDKTTSGGTMPTFDVIGNLVATQTVEITDRTSIYPSSDVNIFGSTTLSNYIGVATTYVYCASAFTLNTSVTHDDGGSVYLNGVRIYGGTNYISTAVAITFNFQKGWNKVDLLWAEQTGNDGFGLGTTLSTNGNISNMTCYYSIDNVSESRLKIAEDNINLKVAKNNVISEINQTSESIKIQASKIDINGAVTFNSLDSSMQSKINSYDAITIGGRNVIIGTKDYSTGWSNGASGNVSLVNNAYLGFTAFKTIANSYPNAMLYDMATGAFTFKSGTIYTISCYAKCDTGTANIAPTVSTTMFDYSAKTISTTWTKYSWTFAHDGGTLLQFRVCATSGASSSNGVYICGIKVEEGNKPSDWCYAIEDTDSKISQAQTDINNYKLVDTLLTINNASDVLFHYDDNLCSTNGENPISGTNAQINKDFGKFGGVATIEESTVNLFTHKTDNTFGVKAGSAMSVLSFKNTEVVYKYSCVGATIQNYYGWDITVDTSKYYTLSGWVFVSTDYNSTNAVHLKGEQGFSVALSYDLGKKGTWQYFKYTAKPSTTNARILMYPNVSTTNGATQGFVQYRNVQFEQKAMATSFYNGTRSIGNCLKYGTYLPEDYTIMSYKRHCLDSSYNHLALTKVGNSFTFYKNGAITTEYQNQWTMYKVYGITTPSTDGIDISKYNNPIEKFYSTDPPQHAHVWNTVHYGVLARTFVYASTPTTVYHRYSYDNYGGVRVNGVMQGTGNYAWQTNTDVRIDLVKGWNLIEIFFVDGDTGGGLGLQKNSCGLNSNYNTNPENFVDSIKLSSTVGVAYMTAELPIEFSSNQIAFNEKSNCYIDEVLISPFIFSTNQINLIYTIGKPFVDKAPKIVVPIPTITTFTIS